MKTKAMFLHKLPEMKTLDCEIEKIIPLSPSEYAKFYQQLLGDYDFITDNNELMGMKDGTAYCILVMNEELDEGILVNSGGSGFARNVSFFPNVSAYLQAQNQKMTQHEKGPRFSSSTAEESPDAVVRQVTPSLLAYGEKVERYVDACRPWMATMIRQAMIFPMRNCGMVLKVEDWTKMFLWLCSKLAQRLWIWIFRGTRLALSFHWNPFRNMKIPSGES